MLPASNQYGAVTRPASSSWVVTNRTANPWASVVAHKRLAALIVLLVTLIGFVAALMTGHEYIAEATIRVSPVVPASLAGEPAEFSSNADYRDFVQEQVFEIDSYATASAALDLLGPQRSLF